MDNITVYKEDVPVIADDSLIAIAKQAEARIDAVVKIKLLALKVTNAADWTSQQDKPYLMVSGAEKIANLFNISWGFLTPEPLYEEDLDGHYTYTFQGRFTMGNRTIEVEGSRSSKDKFFIQYDYPKGKDRVERSIKERDNKRDVKMAALTNMLGNGITRILGIRNLTWEDLQSFADIKKEDVGQITYKTKNKNKPPLEEPQPRKTEQPQGKLKIKDIRLKTGTKNGKKWERYVIIDSNDVEHSTFSKRLAEVAKEAKEKNLFVEIEDKENEYGKELINISAEIESPTPADDNDIDILTPEKCYELAESYKTIIETAINTTDLETWYQAMENDLNQIKGIEMDAYAEIMKAYDKRWKEVGEA